MWRPRRLCESLFLGSQTDAHSPPGSFGHKAIGGSSLNKLPTHPGNAHPLLTFGMQLTQLQPYMPGEQLVFLEYSCNEL